VIFIGPGVDDEAEVEVLGADAAELLAPGGAEGPLVQAAVNDNAAIVSSRVLTSHTVTRPMASCLPALFSFH
jgi:hypothetical protein